MDTPDQPIAAWSRDKLELLDKYLTAYSMIMHSQKQRWLRGYAYIDAFASVGQYQDKETGDYVDGSPVVALKCEPPFDRFWFIERSASRLRNLQNRVDPLAAGRTVHYEHGDANRVLVDRVVPDVPYKGYQRGLVFLDPYGLQVKWDTVRSLAEQRSFDVFMNLSTMGILRLLDVGREPSEQNKAILADIMGSLDWLDNVYTTQMDLFGDARVSRPHLNHDAVAALYLSRLRQLFSHVSSAVVMKNSNGASLYVLFLASHNTTAIKITNDIFRHYERLRLPRP